MSTDGGQHGTHALWQKVLLNTVYRVSPWRVLEGLAVAGVLVWLVASNGRQERAPDAGPHQVAVKAPAPAAPAFSDPRLLVPGAPAAPVQPPHAGGQMPRAAAVQPAPPPAVATPSQPSVQLVPAPVPAAAALAAKPAGPATTPTALAIPPPTVPPKAPTAQSVSQPLAPTSPPAAVSPHKPAQIAANIPPPPSVPVGAAAPAPPRGTDTCPAPDIRITPSAGGQMQVQIASPCRQGQDVGLSYDTVEFRRVLPAGGTGNFTLDLFAGDHKSVDVTFADGTRRVLPAVADDLGQVSKVAVRWRAPVNLDLHVFENGATAGQAGHVWTQAPASAADAVNAARASGRGHGFLNAFDDGPGDKVEIYTYVHGPKDQGTNVAMALDHETRGSQPTGATCGQGVQAKVEFGVILLSRSGDVARAGGTFKPARCDQPLPAAERFDYGLMPVIAVKN